MAELLPSRAQQIGVKPKVLAARTKRQLKNLREKMEQLALPWCDIDNTIEGELQELLAAFDRFESQIDSSIAWLMESPDA